MTQPIFSNVAGLKPEILLKNELLHMYFSRILTRVLIVLYDFQQI